MSADLDAMREERNHWIGEAHRYKRLYRNADEHSTRWFRRMKAAEAKVARIEALVSDYAGAIAVPEWATEYTRGVVDAAQLAHDDLRAALADEGDTDE